MANTPTADTTPADGPASTAAATAAEPQSAASAPRPSGKARWVLTSIAGVGLVGLGLLGGILIGQQTGHPGDRGPEARIIVEHQQSGQNQRIPERVKERVKERMQDHRNGQPSPGQQGPGQQNPGEQPAPTPAPGN
ncbi:MAG: hypothetical protein J0H56_00940 [Micrococcales bacterium]|nr:hypothetical protein [Micrococcales bacterium]